MARPVIYDADLRERLIAAAADQLAEGGENALSLRAVASAADTSTNAIYTLFGNKGSLIAAVVDDAFDSFARAQEAAERSADPMVDLRRLGSAYREWALERPALYAVFFGGRVASGPATPTGSRAMAPLIDAVQRAHAAGVLRAAPVTDIANSVWAAVHGAVSLEAQGLLSGADYENVLDAVIRGWS